MKNLLFLTTANFATNPRLVKEVKLAQTMSCRVTVVLFKLGNWSDAKSDVIARELKESGLLTINYCNATRSSNLPWLFWAIAEKLAQLAYPFMLHSILINALASSRRSFQLLWACRKMKPIPDLICAHNLGALYPAWRLSKKWKIPFVFDVEDFHPGEFIRFDTINEKRRREFLMKELLPQAAAITSASPLIGEYTMKLIGGHQNHQVILNSFPRKEFSEPSTKRFNNSTDQLKLVWFSQKISFGRGLEQLFEAIQLILRNDSLDPLSLSLTLIGDLDPVFEAQIISPLASGPFGKYLQILPPMTQTELHRSLVSYDVGLALEFDDSDLNRQLCLTNKILAYAQAGLYILATDTPAQKQFIQENECCGLLCGQTPEALKDGIVKLVGQVNQIHSLRYKLFEKANVLTWERESSKFKTIIQTVYEKDY